MEKSAQGGCDTHRRVRVHLPPLHFVPQQAINNRLLRYDRLLRVAYVAVIATFFSALALLVFPLKSLRGFRHRDLEACCDRGYRGSTF